MYTGTSIWMDSVKLGFSLEEWSAVNTTYVVGTASSLVLMELAAIEGLSFGWDVHPETSFSAY